MSARRVLGTMLVGILVALASMAGRPLAEASVRAETDLRAADALAACMKDHKRAAVLFLLDQSASLGPNSASPSDPLNIRAAAASLLAGSMAQLAESNGVELWLGAAGFAVDYQDFGGWHSVADGQTEAMTADLKRIGSVSTGWETDYWNALEGARREVKDKTRGDAEMCRAIVWFSDGNFELDVRDTAELRQEYGQEKVYAPGVKLTDEAGRDKALAAGLKSLCRKGGVADQLRDAGVSLLAVGLTGSSDQDFDSMRSVATGESSGESCGDIQDPRNGSFLLARNVDDLLATFDVVPPPVVADAIAVDSSVRSMRVLALAGQSKAGMTLTPPHDRPLKLEQGVDGRRTVDRVSITWNWITGTSAVSLNLDPAGPNIKGWQGLWEITFPTKSGTARWHPEVDLQPTATPNDEQMWRTGSKSATLRFGLDRISTGSPVELDSLASKISLDAELVFRDGASQRLLSNASTAELAEPVKVDLDRAPVGRAEVRMTLSITTAPADGVPGTPLRPTEGVKTLRVLQPAKTPVVIGEVDFGTTEETGPLQASASIGGEGCVWMSDYRVVASPDTVGSVSVTSTKSDAGTCLEVDEGITGSLPVTFSTEHTGNGAVSGDLVFQLAPAGQPGQATSQVVPFSADMRKPPIIPTPWAAVLLTAVGTLVPILILWLVAWWQGRIVAPAGLRVADLTVKVQDGHVVAPDGRAIQVRLEHSRFIPVDRKGQRTLDVDGSVGLKATSRNPLNPHVQVIARNQRVWTSGGRRRLPLSVPGGWILTAAESSSMTLYLLFSGTTSQQGVTDLLARVTRDLDELAPQLPAQREDSSQGYDTPVVGYGASGYGLSDSTYD